MVTARAPEENSMRARTIVFAVLLAGCSILSCGDGTYGVAVGVGFYDTFASTVALSSGSVRATPYPSSVALNVPGRTVVDLTLCLGVTGDVELGQLDVFLSRDPAGGAPRASLLRSSATPDGPATFPGAILPASSTICFSTMGLDTFMAAEPVSGATYAAAQLGSFVGAQATGTWFLFVEQRDGTAPGTNTGALTWTLTIASR
jgi:hypothetical protein